jgi:hypothetical protein
MIAATMFEPARVWLRRGALDRRLARGADPAATPELARRARQLNSRRSRRSLAEGIRNLIAEAEEPQRGFSAAVPPNRRAIMAERDFLLALADDLSSDDGLSPRGIALIEQLLMDGGSPVYTTGSDGDLHRALIRARASLYVS